MNIVKTIVTSSLCVMVTSLSLAMDDAPRPSISSHAISAYVPMALPSLNDVPQRMASSWDSLSNTVSNKMFDESALQKLGWPVNDPLAQQELAKSTLVYERVNRALQQRDFHAGFAHDCDIINRRVQYCQRALSALESHPDGVKLALHCIKHHQRVMNSFDLTRFMSFVQSSTQASQQELEGTEQELALLRFAFVDNPVLNSLVQQTIQQKDEKDKDQ